ncbi:MAG TPA: flagellar basal-body rod protein FlgG [Symbiobacteriaceae bacterium]|nr:flagellar basal-body rod protein FlgG [Symbiobacteriaceae bacterium]
MLRALHTAASGMVAQQVNMDAISHNLANVNTTGFKKGRAEFQDLLYTRIQPPVRTQPIGIVIGQGVRLSSLHRDFTGGSMETTGSDFDVAISGGGFFPVQRGDGTLAYTRDGAFHLDAQRRLATAGGDLLMGAQGPITVPAEAEQLSIGTDGTISYDSTDKGTVVAGRIQLAVFTNPAGLESLGDNLWGATGASGGATLLGAGEKEAGRLVQGYLEGSNVQAVEEMVSLIKAQRAYEINSKVVQSADEMMALTNNLRRG